MGCFRGCFGVSKDGNRRNQGGRFQPRDQRTEDHNTVKSTISVVHDSPIKPINLEVGTDDISDEQLSLSSKKKVTCDSNVKAYESMDFSSPNEEIGNKKENLEQASRRQSSSGSCSDTSSSESYPRNHRYRDCRKSYEEEDEFVSSYEDELCDEDIDDVCFEDVDSRIHGVERKRIEEATGKSTLTKCLAEVTSNEFDQSPAEKGYVHSVLNSIENLTQWKAAKPKSTTQPLNPQKENFSLKQEHLDSLSSFNSKQLKKSTAVDASLSTWLSSSGITPINKNITTNGIDTKTPDKSHISNSMMSQEERHILGSITEERPIVGTVRS